MHLDVPAQDLAGGGENVRLIDVPDSCPRCHRSVHPKHLLIILLRERSLCQVAFRCTHQMCQELFVATYMATNTAHSGRAIFVLDNVEPWAVQKTEFPSTVQDVSPTFVDIFNQAMVAESKGLSQLVGIGLRKGLEFLIKDFASFEHPDQEDQIRSTPLGACITQFVSDPNVKECAKRAVWLGNDETHYTRKWESRDVNDLKLLVRLTVNWIDNAILTKTYIAEMQSNGVGPG